MALNYVTLTGQLPGAAGATAIFTRSGWLTDSTDDLLLPPVPAPVILDGNGKFSVLLLATDNGAPVPSGWTWTVEFIGVPGVAPYYFSFFLPFSGGATQDITSMAPVAAVTAMQAYTPLPTGTALVGQVPTATGVGSASQWATPPLGLPASLGLMAWNYSSLLAQGQAATLASGAVYLIRVPLLGLPLPVTNIEAGVFTAGSGLTAAQCFAGLYSDTGAKIGGTADQSGVWNTAGLKVMPLTGGPFTGSWSFVYAVLISNGTTGPAFARASGGGVGTAIANLHASAANLLFATNGSGATSLPGSLTYSSNSGAANNPQSIWIGLS